MLSDSQPLARIGGVRGSSQITVVLVVTGSVNAQGTFHAELPVTKKMYLRLASSRLQLRRKRQRRTFGLTRIVAVFAPRAFRLYRRGEQAEGSGIGDAT